MEKLQTPARIFYASYAFVLGIQNLIFGTFIATLLPVPKWMTTSPALAYIIGVVLIVLSVSAAFRIKGQAAATLLALFYFLVLLLLHVPKLVGKITDPNEWTVFAEILALCSGGLIAATLLPTDIWEWYGLEDRRLRVRRAASLAFAASLVVFGVLHFKYANFISFLIPAWIPLREFMAYVIGAGFFASAIAITIRVADRIALLTLAAMFFTWVLILHAPRVAQHVNHRDEWSSLFIAVAMTGISIMLAGNLRPRKIDPGA